MTMIQQTPRADRFKEQLRESLQHETLHSRTVRIARHGNVMGSRIRNKSILHERALPVCCSTLLADQAQPC